MNQVNKHIKELEKKVTEKMEDKHQPYFSKYGRYIGNGIYSLAGLHSTDTRELFLMYVCQREFQDTFE